MGITERQWGIAVKHLIGTLDQFSVPEMERNEILAAIATTHDDIVEKPMED
jgi:hypothetical protein